MKKTNILIIFILMLNMTAISQITKNNWMLGGNISYASTKYNSEIYGPPHLSFNLQIKPNVGYFFMDKMAGGIKTVLGKTGTKGGSTFTDFNIGPFVRYYFLNANNDINILSEAGYQYGFEGSLRGVNRSTSKNTFSLSAGPVIYFNSVVGLEVLMTYSTYKFSGVKGSNNTLMFGIGLQIHLEKEK